MASGTRGHDRGRADLDEAWDSGSDVTRSDNSSLGARPLAGRSVGGKQRERVEDKEPNQVGDYLLGATLGVGSFGRVRLATHVRTREKVAIKIVDKATISNVEDVERVYRETFILTTLKHKNIIKLYEVLDTPKAILLVMEYAGGGELYKYLQQRGRMSEIETCRIFHQIVSGVEYCHRAKIIHRDLKLENILLDTEGNVKIADFGLSNSIKFGQKMATNCGTPMYTCPEQIMGKKYIGSAADIWSLGVILFAMVCGFMPFEAPNIHALFRRIRYRWFKVPDYVSKACSELLDRMLTIDPDKRCSVSELRNHAWFLMEFTDLADAIEAKELACPATPEMIAAGRAACMAVGDDRPDRDRKPPASAHRRDKGERERDKDKERERERNRNGGASDRTSTPKSCTLMAPAALHASSRGSKIRRPSMALSAVASLCVGGSGRVSPPASLSSPQSQSHPIAPAPTHAIDSGAGPPVVCAPAPALVSTPPASSSFDAQSIRPRSSGSAGSSNYSESFSVPRSDANSPLPTAASEARGVRAARTQPAQSVFDRISQPKHAHRPDREKEPPRLDRELPKEGTRDKHSHKRTGSASGRVLLVPGLRRPRSLSATANVAADAGAEGSLHIPASPAAQSQAFEDDSHTAHIFSREPLVMAGDPQFPRTSPTSTIILMNNPPSIRFPPISGAVPAGLAVPGRNRSSNRPAITLVTANAAPPASLPSTQYVRERSSSHSAPTTSVAFLLDDLPPSGRTPRRGNLPSFMQGTTSSTLKKKS